ncbi:hypothetical protein BD410DRAFT_780873 [Rickenella mellea]|uniref:BZIP domain-containing protein n=1 Tax=Rickenella mellea TaxID=50990 RepID=A0A4Y7QMU3_9AGAM|nr:hypothetical protein BD410DRAFT_780873 [Rickenella mellea]
MARPPPQPIVSSSSTLWAQASKEWVIPAKPKPGRKPKKEALPPPKDTEEVDSKGRRVQNRAAQRAFRERKQSQLADLQARVQLYEQGEIERNVALQNVAKRLKEENDALRQENTALKDEISKLKSERQTTRNNGRKRWREDSLSLNPTVPYEMDARKRLRTGSASPLSASHITHPASYLPSSPSVASSPESNPGSNNAYSPLPYPPSRAPSVFPSAPMSNASFPSFKPFDSVSSFETFDCGLCNDNTPCVCREIATLSGHKPQTLKIEGLEPRSDISPRPSPVKAETTAPRSILDNLPAYQPPVPLRRPTNTSSLVSPIFEIRFPSPESPRNSPSGPTCSGDPSNCLACADDAFGQAFCSAIGGAVCSNPRCDTCPNALRDESSSSSAAGSPNAQQTLNTISLSPTEPSSPHPQDDDSDPLASETIPCSEAWRQLKSHPNIAFADLSMLADVVARRTKCNGPHVVISPAPGSLTPERDAPSPTRRAFTDPDAVQEGRANDEEPILLVDPHARYHEQNSSVSSAPSEPPSLIPQSILQECGQRRVREVDAAGVREALRLLDVQFGRP